MDPNATGMVVLDAGASHGARLGGSVPAFRLGELMRDGANLYGYLRSRPALGADPLGLYMTWDQTLEIGAQLFANVFETLDGYQADQEAMAEWAMDWSLRDDLFQTTSSDESAGSLGGGLDDLGDEVMAGRSTGVRAGLAAFRTAGRLKSGKIFPSYYAARYAIEKQGRGKALYEAHHIVEARVLSALGKSTNGSAVVLSQKQHRVVTNLLRRELPYGTMIKPENIAMVRAAYRRAYKNYPELLETALKHLDGMK